MEIKIEREVEEFVMKLEKSTIAKVLRTIDLLEQFSHQLGMPHSKKVKSGFFELRIRGHQEVRIFYTFQKREIILLHGFVKKSQKTPQQEINKAARKLQSLT